MLAREKQSMEADLRANQFLAKARLAEMSPQVAGLVHEFNELMARARRAAAHQAHGVRMSRSATQQVRAAVRRLREFHLRPLALIAQAVRDEAPGLANAIGMPRRRLPVTMLLAAAAAIRSIAERHAQVFCRYGRGEAFLEELDAAMREVQSCVARRNRAEQLQVGATKAIAVHLQRARRMVAVLDTIVAARFEGDEPKLAEWRQAKRVQLKAGPKRGHQTPADVFDNVTDKVTERSGDVARYPLVVQHRPAAGDGPAARPVRLVA